MACARWSVSAAFVGVSAVAGSSIITHARRDAVRQSIRRLGSLMGHYGSVVAVSARPSRTAPPAAHPRGFQFVFQPRVLTFEPRPLAFGASAFRFLSFEFATQPRILSPQFVNRIAGRLLGAPAHAPVMPEFRSQYKSDAVTKYDSKSQARS